MHRAGFRNPFLKRCRTWRCDKLVQNLRLDLLPVGSEYGARKKCGKLILVSQWSLLGTFQSLQ
jgi:hypothetical protein